MLASCVLYILYNVMPTLEMLLTEGDIACLS